MEHTAQVTIRRGKTYADSLRAYYVSVDGQDVGYVRAGKLMTFPLAPGKHSLVLEIDWCSSPTVQFEAAPQQHVIFECGSSLPGWRILLVPFYSVFRTHRYLWLRRTA